MPQHVYVVSRLYEKLSRWETKAFLRHVNRNKKKVDGTCYFIQHVFRQYPWAADCLPRQAARRKNHIWISVSRSDVETMRALGIDVAVRKDVLSENGT